MPLNLLSPAEPGKSLADLIEDALPQTQCTRCGYPACRPYAEAIANGAASHNRCPPGGAQGIRRLSALLDKPVLPLDTSHGVERERPLARIDEMLCIGCTLCIQACPVDAILGAAKQMHAVIDELCTGCDLCVAPCPVDCISMVPVTPGRTGWDAWSQDQADQARRNYRSREIRLQRDRQENEERLAAKAAAKMVEVETEIAGSPQAAQEQARKKAILGAAIERARVQAAARQAEQAQPAQPAQPADKPG
ncbi:MAG: electron transport complex subunit RsxB [Janthinobacterium lividum]